MEEDQNAPQFEEVFITPDIKLEPEESDEESYQDEWQHQSHYADMQENEEERDVKPMLIPHSSVPDTYYQSDAPHTYYTSETHNASAEMVYPMHFLEQVGPEPQSSRQMVTPLDTIFATSHTLPGTNIVLKRKLVPFSGEPSSSNSTQKNRVMYLKSPITFTPSNTINPNNINYNTNAYSSFKVNSYTPRVQVQNTYKPSPRSSLRGGKNHHPNLLIYTSAFSSPTNISTTLQSMTSADSLYCDERGHFLNSSKLNIASKKLLTRLSDSSLKSFDKNIQNTPSTSTSLNIQPNSKIKTEPLDNDTLDMVIKPVNPPSAKNAVTFKCQACRKYFKCHDEACRHIFCHTELRPNVCNKCGTCHKFASSLKNHKIKEHSLEKKFKCQTCKRIFRKKNSLKYHILTYHLQEKRYNCAICRIQFFRRSHLLEHLSFRHERSIPYVCTFCNRCMLTKDRLTEHTQFQHMKLITQNNQVVKDKDLSNVRYFCSTCKILVENPGNCRVCNSIIDTIYDHEFIMHVNYIQSIKLKEYGCLVCQEKFAGAYDLKDHMKIEHACSTCDKVYINNYYLFKHLVASLTKSNRKCNFCSDAFVDREMYKNHLDNHLIQIKKKMDAR